MQRLAKALVAVALLALGGCNTVEFYEKGALSSPVMDLGQDACHSAWHQKVTYATEGAAGGLGTSAGGGCGCY